ncbi:hypothetical protein [Rhizobium sp. SSA_523]|uniref:hypothetical protein n=1 Tax=Rhizobium sp. SSA_523 TaxID=2952477 RepID=UPI0020915155|nr:hypothetical protein [Rhizobium sp. SSA_523]MCO5730748.1 hypothetical protein [Rhizobium sp. SSA_523]WKC24428.1 hypothetical protein QTJ18_10220 [Rhizobium sp. SSA_523]
MRSSGAMLLAGLLLLFGCQREAEKLAEFSGHIFVFNYRLSKANYVVTLRPMAPLPEGGSAIARFEDPLGGERLVTQARLYPNMQKIVLESPDLRCVREGRSYSVSIDLADASGKVLQSLSTEVLATLDQSILPKNALVVGPAYDRNPKVFQPAGRLDLSPDRDCPP